MNNNGENQSNEEKSDVSTMSKAVNMMVDTMTQFMTGMMGTMVHRLATTSTVRKRSRSRHEITHKDDRLPRRSSQGPREMSKTRRDRNSSSSSSSDNFDSGSEDNGGSSSIHSRHLGIPRHRGKDNNGVRCPPFTGSEHWNIWFGRFETVADRQGWSYIQRLDELLPKLQGSARDFVFGQLSRDTRNNYKVLIKELNNRYRVVETTKTSAAKFSRRNQNSEETAEEYAAELKRLYDKAHTMSEY